MRKGTGIHALVICISFLIVSEAFAAVTVVPLSYHIPHGQSSTQTVTYQFAGDPSVTAVMTSPVGTFMADSEPIGSVSVPVTISVHNGAGRASESILVPVAVIERALRRGTAGITYARIFSGTGIGPFTTVVNFTLTTGAGAGFGLTRIMLYFDNRRPEVLVERNQQVRAYADIAFVGSGLLQGYWEVDGRVLSYVNRHLAFGGSITLQTPAAPSLPSFDSGTHIVRFVIRNPATDIPSPSILYFVFPEGASCSMASIVPVEPPDGFSAPYGSLRFAWERVEDTTIYLIGFYTDEKPDSKPIFSAYTKDIFYTLPEQAVKTFFDLGLPYYWKVKGFDKESAMICDGTMQQFSFRQKG